MVSIVCFKYRLQPKPRYVLINSNRVDKRVLSEQYATVRCANGQSGQLPIWAAAFRSETPLEGPGTREIVGARSPFGVVSLFSTLSCDGAQMTPKQGVSLPQCLICTSLPLSCH